MLYYKRLILNVWAYNRLFITFLQHGQYITLEIKDVPKEVFGKCC